MEQKTVVHIKEPQAYRVYWIDPHSVDEWIDKDSEDLKSMKTVKSVGYLISETSSYIVLSLNWCPDTDMVSCSMHIPRRCIQSMDYIKP